MELREDKKSIMRNVAVIDKATALLPDNMPEDTKKLWKGVPDRVNEALDLVAEDDVDKDRKYACIEDATAKYANQICFYLFRANLLTPELSDEFRKLATPEDTTRALEKHEAIMKKLEDDLLKERDALIARNDSYELIQAVLGGYSVEEAKKRQAEYKSKAAQALGAK